jgi:phosphosulfolactate synthase
MNAHRFLLDLPARPEKPRRRGLTMVIDGGMPCGLFADALGTGAEFIDIVKFGWGTALVTAQIERKIRCCREHGVRFCFGGSLFEKFALQDRFDGFVDMCRHFGCDMIEISNGTIPMSNREKAEYVRACCREFTVASEVGFKDQIRSDLLTPADWIASIEEDLAAGASLVVTEARESGRSGMCRANGRLRDGLVEAILASGIDPDRLVFEAPTKDLQTHLVTMLGPNVNLGNVAVLDALALETLRLGLRSDTMLHFDTVPIHA